MPLCSSTAQGWAAKGVAGVNCERCRVLLDIVADRWRVCERAADVAAWLTPDPDRVAVWFVMPNRVELRSRGLPAMRHARRLLGAAAFPLSRDSAMRLVQNAAHLLSLTGAANKAATELCALAQQYTESRNAA